MKLLVKINIALISVIILGTLIASSFTRSLLEENAREEVFQTAGIILESAIAVRSYTATEIRPLLVGHNDEKFLPQSVPAYSAHKFIEKLRTTHPEYNYKEATLNPTNPAHKATQWEADIVTWFRNNTDKEELIGERETPTGPHVFMSRPLAIKNAACLECHGVPKSAPATMIESYGMSNGFGWKMDEVVGAQVVSVPMDVPLERSQNAHTIFMAALISTMMGIVILINVLLYFIVVKPVKRLSSSAEKFSKESYTYEEIPIKGSDELASLGRSFNVMQRSLVNAYELMEEEYGDKT